MSKLATLEQPHVFPPRRFLLTIWIFTGVVALYGIIATPGFTFAIYAWMIIVAISLWQLWTLRWVVLDAQGISVRNVFRQGRSLRWEEITNFQEQELQLNKGTYSVLRLSNEGAGGDAPRTRIVLTHDQVNFPMLRDLVREAMAK